MGKGTLFIISAPSGAGKSTLIQRLRPMFPDMLYSVSCTTRQPRKGEIEGVHYYFLNKERFREMAEADQFLEWKEVHSNLYGTPAGPVVQALTRGLRIILDIDVQGGLQVFTRIPDAVGIFVTARDLETLEERLRHRGTDAEESIRTRMRNAPGEMELGKTYRYRVVNDDLERAVNEVSTIIRNESSCRCHAKHKK